MFAYIRAFSAAIEPGLTRPFQTRLGALAVLSGVILLLAGCADAPPYPLAGPDPSDPGARTPRVGYRSTIGPYTSRRPVAPGPWQEQNQRVAPQPKSAE